MRYFTCVLVALCLSASMLYAKDPPRLSPAEQEVVDVSKARIDAANRRDKVAVAGYFADDCLLSTDDGTLITKTQLMEHYRKTPAAYEHLVDPRDHVVRLHGNTAVLNYRVTGHEQFGDTDIISEQRRTETWIKQGGSWLLVAVQWDNIPVNFRKPVAVGTNTFKDYAGDYKSRPTDDIETIFLKDGRLWSRVGEDVAEYLPAGGDDFFLQEGDLGVFTFSRDNQGHVTGYTYHRIDGQEIPVKKIK